MGTGKSLSAPQRVQRLRRALHAKAKESPGSWFYSLCDKVWRADVLAVAWQEVRRNGGAAGVDGQTVADIEAYGVGRWLGELARELKAGTYRPDAVRQVLIPKKQRRKVRPLGIPCIRDRVAQTAAMLVLSPIFEADLRPEQYAYRAGRSAHDAVKRVHRTDNGLGELLLPGPSQSGVRSGGPTHDPAAAPMAVPQAQGEVWEIRAIFGHETVGRVRAHSPCSANGQLSVGEAMISSESPTREIRTLGSPSGDWKRSHGVY